MKVSYSLLLFALIQGVLLETLKVDLTQNLHEARHCASGSLYGITATLPENIEEMVKPLNPNVFVNPAKCGPDNQHNNNADAFTVAERIMDTTGKVQILMSDIYKGYYAFDNMDHWKKEVQEVVAKRKASKANNFDGYVLWNEPDISWKNDKPFPFDSGFWKPTYDMIRELDPDQRIIGPSYSWYHEDVMEKFLSYCKENKCLPDVISWHNGGDETIPDPIKSFRKLCQKYGIDPPLPISVNEYCSWEHGEEGCPGVNAHYIAKYERYDVESAGITWWFTPLPGRLGSLLTQDNQKGAGWYFYKWYGEMTGYMAAVTPIDEYKDKVDGFANVDEEKKYASLLFGGNSVGDLDIVFTKIPEFFGDKVHAKVEKVVWKNKDTPSNGPELVSEDDIAVSNGGLTVKTKIENKYYGYRVYLTPAGAASE